ncbi:HAD family hydrolase [Nonomuraea rubra]|uniref:HAD family hydrolase n=1 Tax=Nonomuraea rubra TaxID=46180 RepID=UPI0033FC446C
MTASASRRKISTRRPAGVHRAEDGRHQVLIAGNQTARVAELLGALDLPVDGIATSGQWGVAKPDPAFFARLIEFAGAPPDQIVYVGDHPSNDVTPAKAAGLRAAHVRRGPWGHLWADGREVAAADWRVSSLTELAGISAPEV